MSSPENPKDSGAVKLDAATIVPVAGASIAGKLRTLPKQRLITLLGERQSAREIGERIRSSRKSRTAPEKPLSVLARLPRDHLVKMLTDVGIDDAEAGREFNEYRFTQRPSLYLRSSPVTIDTAQLEPDGLAERLTRALEALNAELAADEETPPSRGFRLEEVVPPDADGLIEIRYAVQHRVDLVDPATLEPRTEYTAVLGAVWLDSVNRYCLINAGRGPDADNIASALAKALGIPHLYPVTLTDALLERVVDEEHIKSGAFVRSDGSTRPRSIRLSDDELVRKTSYGELRADGGYRPTYAYYRHRLPGTTETNERIGVGMTRRAGRIWIPYPLARTDLVNWAKRFIRTIAEQQAHFLESDVTEAVAARRDALVVAMPTSWNRPDRREALLALLPAVAECRKQGLEQYPLTMAGAEIARALRPEWLAVQLEGSCQHCGNDVAYRCPACDRSRFAVEPDGAFACRGCTAAAELLANPMERCECGEEIRFNAATDLTLYPSSTLIDLVDTLLRVVHPDLNLERYAYVVEGSSVRLLEDRAAPEVLRLGDVVEFGNPADFGFYADEVQQRVEHRLDRCEAGLEKCNPFDREKSAERWPCDSCSPRPHLDRECLRTIVIDRVGDGKIEPHTGTEIGDLVFTITVRGQRLKVIAFGKGHGSELRATTAEGRALLSQIWQRHDDENFQVIGILSSALVAQNMRIAVEGMARYGRKSVLYLGRQEVERLLAENISSGTDKGPPGGVRCKR